MSSDPTIFVGTPIHSSQVHLDWVAGALSMGRAFPGRHVIEAQKGSFLPKQRDQLTRKFFDSGCSHFLCVDSDIGWSAEDINRLLSHDVDFVSGIYSKKNAARDLPFSWTGERRGGLLGCEWAPGGFLLIKRQVIERMMGAYAGRQYTDGDGTRLWSLWMPEHSPETAFSAEDVMFCKRWRALGGAIWADSDVVLKHHGETVYLPKDGWTDAQMG